PPPGTVPAAVDMLPAVHHSADRYSTMSATRLAAAVRAGEVTAVDLAEAALAAAEQSQTRLNAFISITHERVRQDAAKLDANRDANPDANPDANRDTAHRGALAGVPVVVKDNLCVAGERTTAGSRLLADFVPPYSATVVDRLTTAGAVLVAKANMDEFGMGSTNENSAYGPVKNPHAED